MLWLPCVHLAMLILFCHKTRGWNKWQPNADHVYQLHLRLERQSCFTVNYQTVNQTQLHITEDGKCTLLRTKCNYVTTSKSFLYSPVLQGEKFAANLWIHNTVRFGVKGFPANDAKARRMQPDLRQVTFSNNGIDPDLQFAELYYGDHKFWAILGHGDPAVTIDTAKEGDVYNLKVDGKTIKSWIIGEDKSYSFTF
jgi:hypothetical protein